jgi:hypothetical protein
MYIQFLKHSYGYSPYITEESVGVKYHHTKNPCRTIYKVIDEHLLLLGVLKYGLVFIEVNDT